MQTIDENEDVSDDALEVAGAGAWTFVCTGGFQCNSLAGCFNEKSRLRDATEPGLQWTLRLGY